MSKPLLRSILFAVTLAAGLNGPTAAAPPDFVMCEFDSVISPLKIRLDGQSGSMRDAVHHCLFFWNGKVRGAGRDQ